ncbi:hypothetical protein [Kitasatospora sp. NPDC096140]|uniref:hypothetical protein n=1 Tax=unclassified Kitasatospora TaxID=2633591 RepID=UPI00332DD7D2
MSEQQQPESGGPETSGGISIVARFKGLTREGRVAVSAGAGVLILLCAGVPIVLSRGSDTPQPPPPPATTVATASVGGVSGGPTVPLPPCGESKSGVSLGSADVVTERTKAEVKAEINCAVQPGGHLVWMIVRDGMGTPEPHTNYYPKGELPGINPLTIPVSGDTPGTVRTVQVAILNQETFEALARKAAQTTDGAIPEKEMPPAMRWASNPMRVVRGS